MPVGDAQYMVTVVLFPGTALDEPHEPVASGLSRGGLFPSADVEPQ